MEAPGQKSKASSDPLAGSCGPPGCVVLANPEIGPHGGHGEAVESRERKGRGVVPGAFRVGIGPLKGQAVEVAVAAFVLPDGYLNRAFPELLNRLFRHGLSSFLCLTQVASLNERGRGNAGAGRRTRGPRVGRMVRKAE